MMETGGVIRTRHRMPACVAGAIAPDNLSSMQTRARGSVVETSISGTALRSIIASVDDYLMNLSIAEDACSCISQGTLNRPGDERELTGEEKTIL